VLDLPFLLADYDHAYSIVDGEVGKALLGDLESKGMNGLAFWKIGFRKVTNGKRAQPDDRAVYPAGRLSDLHHRQSLDDRSHSLFDSLRRHSVCGAAARSHVPAVTLWLPTVLSGH
jgi:hypothetical protein